MHKIEPLDKHILVAHVQTNDRRTAGGIIMPEASKGQLAKSFFCKVVAVGPGRRNERTGEREPIAVAVGDVVLVSEHSFSIPVWVDGQDKPMMLVDEAELRARIVEVPDGKVS